MSNLFHRLLNAMSNARSPAIMRPELADAHRREHQQRLQRPVSMVWLLILATVVIFVVILLITDAARAVEWIPQ